jgi:hypothetical protein
MPVEAEKRKLRAKSQKLSSLLHHDGGAVGQDFGDALHDLGGGVVSPG